jgi:hypothetical protein
VQTSGSSDSTFRAFILDFSYGEVVLSLHDRIILLRNRRIDLFNKLHSFVFLYYLFNKLYYLAQEEAFYILFWYFLNYLELLIIFFQFS